MNIDRLHPLIELALKEDVGKGDITTEAIIPDIGVKAAIIAKGEGIIAGLDIAEAIFHHIACTTKFRELVRDGDKVCGNQVIVWLDGKANDILVAERTALNFLSRLSGIATLTAKYVERVESYDCKILDTRKTMPCFRELEKYAVKTGGGQNHRFGLYDMVLIKDNHLKLSNSASKVKELVSLAKEKVPREMQVEVEVNSLEVVKEAYESRADVIMLDNMSIDEMRIAVEWVRSRKTGGRAGKTILEASGGINLSNVKDIAKTGVDWISIGELTHSAPALDTSLEIMSKIKE